MDLSILIVHYNTPKLLAETLRSIRRAAPRLNYEVIVVDNNPSDRLPSKMKTQFPEVRFIQAQDHLGFGGGNNLAAKTAQGRHVLVFNPDIFVEYGAFETLTKFLDENENVGVVGAQLRNPDGTLQYSCYKFNRPYVKVLRRTPFRRVPKIARLIDEHLMRDVSHEGTMDVDWLMGACLCIRRDVWDELDGFDERFTMYFEDTDFCRRVWNSGKRVVYYPGVSMVHYHRREGASGNLFKQLVKRTNRLHIKSWLLYTKKYYRVPHPRI